MYHNLCLEICLAINEASAETHTKGLESTTPCSNHPDHCHTAYTSRPSLFLFRSLLTSRPALLTHAPIVNVGLNPHLISTHTIANVVAAYPRRKWTNCFAEAMLLEKELKPWCHTTATEGFIEQILANELMAPFDG